MKNSTLKICNATIHPGESLTLALPLPELYSCTPMYMPIKVLHGKQAGPVILLTAGMHGGELNGTEIINRLLSMPTLKRLHGTVIAIPVVNVYGLLTRSWYLPGKIDIDRCFPGTESGPHAARFAYIFTQEIFSKANYYIDLITGEENIVNIPQLYTDFNNKESLSLAQKFGVPVISKSVIMEGSLRSMAVKNEVPFVIYKAGEAFRFDEHAIRVGVKGIINFLRQIKMLPEPQQKSLKQPESYHSTKSTWVYSPTSGINHSAIKLGQYVEQGELLCTIQDPFGMAEEVKIKSPCEGIIISKHNLPLLQEGDVVFQLAMFAEAEEAATHLQLWQNQSNKQHETSE